MSLFGQNSNIINLALEFQPISKGIFMIQSQYIELCLELFGLDDSQSVATPMVEPPRLKEDIQEQYVDPILDHSMWGNSSSLHTLDMT